MKYLLLLAVLMAATQAIRLRDFDDDEESNELEIDNNLANQMRVEARDIQELSALNSNGVYSTDDFAVIP